MDAFTGLCIGGDLDGAWRTCAHTQFRHSKANILPVGQYAPTMEAAMIQTEFYAWLRPGGHLGDKGFWICRDAYPKPLSPNQIVEILALGYRVIRIAG